MGKNCCLIAGCENEAHARGLCRQHWHQWRHGRILHPEIGEWKASVKKLEKQEPREIPLLFHEFRQRIKQASDFARVLRLLGHEDQVKKEIGLFAQKYK